MNNRYEHGTLNITATMKGRFTDMEIKRDKNGRAILDDELFELFTRYINQGDNRDDNTRRAEILGFGGRNIQVAPGAIIRLRSRGSIGNHVFIGLYTYINGDVIIGDDVLIGPHCSLAAGNHKFDPAAGWFGLRTEPDGDESIHIGSGSWLATGVTVTGGVRIGRCNLICANSVVTRSTDDYSIMAGTPAKKIGYIEPDTGRYVWETSQS